MPGHEYHAQVRWEGSTGAGYSPRATASSDPSGARNVRTSGERRAKRLGRTMSPAHTRSAGWAPRWIAAGPASSTPIGPKTIEPKAS